MKFNLSYELGTEIESLKIILKKNSSVGLKEALQKYIEIANEFSKLNSLTHIIIVTNWDTSIVSKLCKTI